MIMPARLLRCSAIVFFVFSFIAPALCAAQSIETEQLLRQQERERELRQRNETQKPLHLPTPTPETSLLPLDEVPCHIIHTLVLQGDASEHFQWTLAAADRENDPARGRCLGPSGIALVIQRVQQAILERGYVTTRVLAEKQDIRDGTLTLTLLPGRIRHIRFADGTTSRATLWNAIPAKPGDLLNTRVLEQGLDNFKRLPSAEASLRINAAQDAHAAPGESDVIIEWTQAMPFRLNLSLDDAGSKYTGKHQAALTLAYDHWWTLNDLFYLSVNQAVGGGLPGDRGSQAHTVHYSVPWKEWLLSATATTFEYHQLGLGLNQYYSYHGKSDNQELAITRLLYRNSLSKTSASLRWWSRESRNFIDDTEVRPQRRDTGGWELGLNHRLQLYSASIEANLAARRGTGAFGSRPAPEEAFGEGTSRMQILRADATLSLPFRLASQRLRYVAGWRAQWNGTPLTPQDRFAIGTRYTVRGFDGESFLSGDNGWLLRQELGLSLVPMASELYAGIDTGRVGGRSTETLPDTRLTGAVIGLRGNAARVSWDLFVGRPVDKPEGFRTSSTTAGFYLGLNF
jgi:hemolysin activation/secretion protein